jgi:ferredoxin
VTYKHGTDTDDCDHVGEFTVDELRAVLPTSSAEVKICGPGRFMQAMYDACVELGVPSGNIGWEAFGPSTVIPAKAADKSAADSAADPCAPMVTFADSGIAVPWDPASPSLLDFAEEQGVYPNYSCRQGSCESCMTSVKSGEFEYIEPPFQAPEEGFVLLCCSRPVTDIELDV